MRIRREPGIGSPVQEAFERGELAVRRVRFEPSVDDEPPFVVAEVCRRDTGRVEMLSVGVEEPRREGLRIGAVVLDGRGASLGLFDEDYEAVQAREHYTSPRDEVGLQSSRQDASIIESPLPDSAAPPRRPPARSVGFIPVCAPAAARGAQTRKVSPQALQQ
jgi:hypothetical protein